MRLLIGLVALVSAGLAAPAQAADFYFDLTSFQTAVPTASLIEDFESVSGAQLDTPLPSLTRASGTYVGMAGGPFPNVFVSSPGYLNYGAGNNPTTSKILTANGDESFDVTLSGLTRALGLNLYLNDFGDATVAFYSQSGALLGSVLYPSGADNFQFLAFRANPGDLIGRFTFTSTNGGTLNTGIDNLLCGAVCGGAVPEPASWAMMLLGFGVMGGAMRRRARVRVTFA